MAEQTVRENATDFLIRSLETMEGAEDVILVFRTRDKDGNDVIDWLANDVKLWHMLGILEYVKQDICKEDDPE